MSIEVWADNATGTLGAPGTTGDTTISVAQATGVFPSSLSGGEVFHLVIDFDTINAEIVEVTANSGSVEAGWTMTLGHQVSPTITTARRPQPRWLSSSRAKGSTPWWPSQCYWPRTQLRATLCTPRAMLSSLDLPSALMEMF